MIKKPEDTQTGRYLSYFVLIIAVISFLLGQNISVKETFFPDKPNLAVVESFNREQRWSVAPPVYDLRYCDNKNETNSDWLSPIPLSISIKNKGKESVEVTRLDMEYQPIIKIINLKEKDENTLLTRDIIQTKEPIHKIHDLGTINPGELIEIKDADWLMFENLINLSVNSTTKDNYSITSIISLVLTYIIDYTIYTKNNEPISGQFNITVGSEDYFINNTIPFTAFKLRENCTMLAEYIHFENEN